jgi:hypothetical protein
VCRFFVYRPIYEASPIISLLIHIVELTDLRTINQDVTFRV